MEIIRTDDFERAFAKLPASAKRLYAVQEERFQIHRHDARLHIKKVEGLDGVYSFRVTRRYRVLFYFSLGERAVFFDIDHRKNVYRRMKSP